MSPKGGEVQDSTPKNPVCARTNLRPSGRLHTGCWSKHLCPPSPILLLSGRPETKGVRSTPKRRLATGEARCRSLPTSSQHRFPRFGEHPTKELQTLSASGANPFHSNASRSGYHLPNRRSDRKP